MLIGMIATLGSGSFFPFIYYLNGQVAGVFLDYVNYKTLQLTDSSSLTKNNRTNTSSNYLIFI